MVWSCPCLSLQFLKTKEEEPPSVVLGAAPAWAQASPPCPLASALSHPPASSLDPLTMQLFLYLSWGPCHQSPVTWPPPVFCLLWHSHCITRGSRAHGQPSSWWPREEGPLFFCLVQTQWDGQTP